MKEPMNVPVTYFHLPARSLAVRILSSLEPPARRQGMTRRHDPLRTAVRRRPPAARAPPCGRAETPVFTTRNAMMTVLEFSVAAMFAAVNAMVWFCLLMSGWADRKASTPDGRPLAAEPGNFFPHQPETKNTKTNHRHEK